MSHMYHITNGLNEQHLVMRTQKCIDPKCREQVTFGLPFCREHLIAHTSLEIKTSDIEGAGDGLFARDPKRSPGADPDPSKVIFPKSTPICDYRGEILTTAQFEHRYHMMLPEYSSMSSNPSIHVDAARERWACAYINSVTYPDVKTATREQIMEAQDSANAALHMRHDIYPFVAAAKDIHDGEEILLDYGMSFWMKKQSTKSRSFITKNPFQDFNDVE